MGILKEDINWYNDMKPSGRVIGWWSGGVASAIACKIALEEYDNVHLAFCDTGIEHPDTYRFMDDFERVLGVKIHKYKSERFDEPEDVWRKYLGLNFANGAPCSTMLKREVRTKLVQDIENDYAQVFGFDYCDKEINRAKGMIKSYPEINPKFPLIEHKITREGLFREVSKLGIEAPVTYKLFLNNNCIGAEDSEKGGCVQGGVGYWQKLKRIYPKKYNYMAKIEHELTDLKLEKLKDDLIQANKGGDSIKIQKAQEKLDEFQPVTLLRDQRKSKGTYHERLFLVHNPSYPEYETIDVIKGRQPVTPMECNGFCSLEDGSTLYEQELF